MGRGSWAPSTCLGDDGREVLDIFVRGLTIHVRRFERQEADSRAWLFKVRGLIGYLCAAQVGGRPEAGRSAAGAEAVSFSFGGQSGS